YVAAKATTMHRRRQKREQEAYMQSTTNTESETWTQIAPLLDAAMAELGENEHSALVLRFFQGRSFRELGASLATTEAGAKMRVQRALVKLRKYFYKRGLTFSVAMIAGAIATNSVQAAPVGLAGSATLAAVKGTAVAASTLTLIQSTLKYMTWLKIKSAAVL